MNRLSVTAVNPGISPQMSVPCFFVSLPIISKHFYLMLSPRKTGAVI